MVHLQVGEPLVTQTIIRFPAIRYDGGAGEDPFFYDGQKGLFGPVLDRDHEVVPRLPADATKHPLPLIPPSLVTSYLFGFTKFGLIDFYREGNATNLCFSILDHMVDAHLTAE